MKKTTILNLFWWALFLSFLIFPRVFRICYHKIWFEDPTYLYIPYLMMKGQTPYYEFSHPHFSVLEEFLTLLYRAFGASYRTMEALTNTVVFLTAIIIFFCGRRLINPFVGAFSAIFFSYSHLFWRYHIFEREHYTALIQAILFFLLIKWEKFTFINLAFIASLFLVGYTMKETMIIHIGSVLIYLFFVKKERKKALILGFLTIIGLIAVNLFFYFLYGQEFLNQTFLFHFVKGRSFGIAFRIFGLLTEAGIPLVFGTIGLVLSLIFSKNRIWALFLLDIALNVLFYFYSLAFWPHYIITILCPLSIGSASLVLMWLGQFNFMVGGRMTNFLFAFSSGDKNKNPIIDPPKFNPIIFLIPISLPLLILSGYFTPHLPFPDNLGLGGYEKSIFEVTIRFIKEKTDPSDAIIAPPYIALEADRMNLINFMDNYGNMLWLREIMRKGKFFEARKMAQRLSFAQVRGLTTQLWWNQAISAIKEHKVKMVIPYFEFPVDAQFLLDNFFKLKLKTDYHSIYLYEEKQN